MVVADTQNSGVTVELCAYHRVVSFSVYARSVVGDRQDPGGAHNMPLVVGVVVERFFDAIHTVFDHVSALKGQQTQGQALFKVFTRLQTVKRILQKEVRPFLPLCGVTHHGVIAVEI